VLAVGADSVLVMRSGRIAERGAPREVLPLLLRKKVPHGG
jgi:hypothetical protein